MKKLFLISFLIINLIATAQDNSINFHKELSWQQVLDSAASENKLVFVDLYTDWCVPCKRMDKEVFSLKDVAEVFNKRFINYKINAEIGEGIALAKKYRVEGYPYFLFTDSKGNLVYSLLGYRGERELLQEADIAYKELNDPKPLGIWQSEYESKKYDLSWLASYIQKRNKLRMDNSQLLEDYYVFLKPADYMTAKNLSLIIKSSGIELNGNLFNIVTKHFNEIDPKEDTTHSLESSLLDVFETAINKKVVMSIEQNNERVLLDEIAPAYLKFPLRISNMPWYERQDENKWKFIFYNQTADSKKLIPVADKYLQKYYFNLTVSQIKQSDSIIFVKCVAEYKKRGLDTSSPMIKQYFSTFTTNDHLERLLGATYTIYKNSKNPTELMFALNWAKRAVDIQQNATTSEFYSKILYALDRKQEAITFLQKAIEITGDNNEKEKLNSLLSAMNQNKSI